MRIATSSATIHSVLWFYWSLKGSTSLNILAITLEISSFGLVQILKFKIYTTILSSAITCLKYCQYGVKHYSINQSIHPPFIQLPQTQLYPLEALPGTLCSHKDGGTCAFGLHPSVLYRTLLPGPELGEFQKGFPNWHLTKKVNSFNQY